MTRHIARIVVAAVLVAVSAGGCGSDGDTTSSTPSTDSPAAAADVSAETIQDVWWKIGCKPASEDPRGSAGLIDLSAPEPPLEHTGDCRPFGGEGGTTFFYQLADHDAALGWLDSGDLEIGSTDTVFVDGSVVVLATDAETARLLASELTPYK